MLYALIFEALTVLFGPRTVPAAQIHRYADAIVVTVERERLPFSGRHAKERSALLLLALAYQESSLIEDVELCRWKPRPGMTQDQGHSVGLTQLYEGYSWRGHTREEICSSAELQFGLAMRYLAEQRQRCGDVERSLGSYNSNVCQVSSYAARTWNRYRRLARALGVRP